MSRLRPRTTRAATLGIVSAMALAGCGLTGNDDASSASPQVSVAPEDAVVITMAVWGGFGLDTLIAEYQQDHPGVVIELQTGDYNPLHDELQRELVSGVGAPTIAAIGEDYIAKFAAQPSDFVDLGPLGASDYEDAYLPWKWAQGTSSDGSAVLGMGADVGGLALCYRTDLFEAAGLPFEREAVEAEIGDTWEGFLALGAKYSAASSDAAFIDSGTSLLGPARAQSGAAYYDAAGALAMAPTKPSFDIAASAISSGLSAGLTQFSDEWDRGLSTGSFATTLCPVWMMGYIQGVVTETESEAQWDIADIPGPGGSWGGAFYTIPSQASAEEQAAAWEFLEWLMQPTQQLAAFQATGSLPSQPALYDDESVKEYTIDFFQDAPVGTILAKSVTDLPVAASYDAKNGVVESTMEQVLDEVQTGTITAADAWAVAEEAAALADSAP